jgi:hypothetical protein
MFLNTHIGCAQCLDVGVREADAIALRQREYEFGFERAFDVDVQLCLGHATEQFGQALAGDRAEVHKKGSCLDITVFIFRP